MNQHKFLIYWNEKMFSCIPDHGSQGAVYGPLKPCQVAMGSAPADIFKNYVFIFRVTLCLQQVLLVCTYRII